MGHCGELRCPTFEGRSSHTLSQVTSSLGKPCEPFMPNLSVALTILVQTRFGLTTAQSRTTAQSHLMEARKEDGRSAYQAGGVDIAQSPV